MAFSISKVVLFRNEPDSVNNTQNSLFSLVIGRGVLEMIDQRERLEKEILNWRGNLQQVDDILFIGTKIPGC